MLLQDLRQNPRLTPLLPYLVTFSRVCLNRYKENSVVTGRLIRNRYPGEIQLGSIFKTLILINL